MIDLKEAHSAFRRTGGACECCLINVGQLEAMLMAAKFKAVTGRHPNCNRELIRAEAMLESIGLNPSHIMWRIGRVAGTFLPTLLCEPCHRRNPVVTSPAFG